MQFGWLEGAARWFAVSSDFTKWILCFIISCLCVVAVRAVQPLPGGED